MVITRQVQSIVYSGTNSPGPYVVLREYFLSMFKSVLVETYSIAGIESCARLYDYSTSYSPWQFARPALKIANWLLGLAPRCRQLIRGGRLHLTQAGQSWFALIMLYISGCSLLRCVCVLRRKFLLRAPHVLLHTFRRECSVHLLIISFSNSMQTSHCYCQFKNIKQKNG